MVGNILIDDVDVVEIFKADWLVLICCTMCGIHMIWNIQLQVKADYFSSECSRHWNKQALKHHMEIPLKDGCRVLSRTSPSGGWMNYRWDPALAFAPGLHYMSVFTHSRVSYKLIEWNLYQTQRRNSFIVCRGHNSQRTHCWGRLVLSSRVWNSGNAARSWTCRSWRWWKTREVSGKDETWW